MNIFTQFFKKQSQADAKQSLEREILRREAALAKSIFGPVQPEGKREFFCLDENTWVWYEEWIDDAGDRQQVTTRYLIRDREIVKSQNGGAYVRLNQKEMENFKQATDEYIKRAEDGLYKTLTPQK